MIYESISICLILGVNYKLIIGRANGKWRLIIEQIGIFVSIFALAMSMKDTLIAYKNDALFKGKLLYPTAFMLSIPFQLVMIFIRLLYFEVNGYGPTVNYPTFQQIGHQIFLTVFYIFESLRIVSSFGYPFNGGSARYFSNWFCVLFLIKTMQVKMFRQSIKDT